MALEPEFWSALAAMAVGRGMSLSALIAETDAGRPPTRPLASALRVHALQHAKPVVQAEAPQPVPA